MDLSERALSHLLENRVDVSSARLVRLRHGLVQPDLDPFHLAPSSEATKAYDRGAKPVRCLLEPLGSQCDDSLEPGALCPEVRGAVFGVQRPRCAQVPAGFAAPGAEMEHIPPPSVVRRPSESSFVQLAGRKVPAEPARQATVQPLCAPGAVRKL